MGVRQTGSLFSSYLTGLFVCLFVFQSFFLIMGYMPSKFTTLSQEKLGIRASKKKKIQYSFLFFFGYE